MVRDYVKGTTKVFGVIGDPIKHTFSPIIHNTIALQHGHDIVYTPFHVLQEDLGAAVKGAFALGICGINVTIPHKKEVINHIYKVEGSAVYAGAVNTLKLTEKGYIGYNTDIIGIRKTFENNQIDLEGKIVVIIGAGGSAEAAVYAALDGKAKKIFIVNRTLQNAKHIAEKTKQYYNIEIIALSYEDVASISRADVVVQTTPVGFSHNDDKSPIEDKHFYEIADVYFDIIYTPWETVFLKEAAKHGKVCINGFDMLVYQAVAAYEIWLDVTINKTFLTRIKDELSVYYSAK